MYIEKQVHVDRQTDTDKQRAKQNKHIKSSYLASVIPANGFKYLHLHWLVFQYSPDYRSSLLFVACICRGFSEFISQCIHNTILIEVKTVEHLEQE